MAVDDFVTPKAEDLLGGGRPVDDLEPVVPLDHGERRVCHVETQRFVCAVHCGFRAHALAHVADDRAVECLSLRAHAADAQFDRGALPARRQGEQQRVRTRGLWCAPVREQCLPGERQAVITGEMRRKYAADQFAFVAAQQRTRGLVRRTNVAVGIDLENGIRCAFDQHRRARFGLSSGGFQLGDCSQVLGLRYVEPWFACLVADQCHVHHDVKGPAVLAYVTFRDRPAVAAALEQVGAQCLRLREVVGVRHAQPVQFEQLLRLVAHHGAERLVDGCPWTVQRAEHQAEMCVVECRTKARLALFECGDGFAQAFGSLPDLPFEVMREFAVASFRLASLDHLPGELIVRLGQLRRGRQREQFRQQRPQRERRGERYARGDALQQALQRIVGVPERPYGHDVCRAAQQDERREHHDHAAVTERRAAAHEGQQHERDREVGQRNHGVGHDVQREQVGAPQQAHAVGHQAGGIEEVGHGGSTG